MKPLLKTEYFFVLYRPGREWIKRKSVREQPLEGHLAWVKMLRERGTVRLGGPFKDDAGGMILLETTTLQAAIEITQNDPAVQTQVITPEVHPWHPAVGGDVQGKPW